MNKLADFSKTKGKKKTYVEKKGSSIILDTLLLHNIKTIFGYPGGCVIPLFDELLNYPQLKLILVRHEQAATHAADGLARATGKAGVVIATSGPGATNCVTGIATAMMDSIPMIVITGQVKKHLIGSDAFQETNIIGISRPITKQNYLVKDISQLKFTIEEAFYIAETGRPGPVLIDIPVDVQRETYSVKNDKKTQHIHIPGYQPDVPIVDADIKKVWKLIQKAKKPLIYGGAGLITGNAQDEIYTFVNKTKIPIATTILGQGAFPEKNKYALGMLGMHGNYTANISTTKADLCIALGARFDDRVTGKVDDFLENATIIHVDIDESSLEKVKPVDVAILGNVKTFLQKINVYAESLKVDDWWKELNTLKKEYPNPDYENISSNEGAIRPEYIIKKLSEIVDGNAYIVTDVGQHQMFTCLHYDFRFPRTQITSGGLGTMGFAVPAALGIACEKNDRPIISISGDGGFQMNSQELATIRSYDLPVKIVIFNNNNLGMVKQWQDLFWDNRLSSTVFFHNPDFVKLGESYGIPSFRVTKKEDVVASIHKMIEPGTCLVEYCIDFNAHVFPMVPAGESVKNIIYQP